MFQKETSNLIGYWTDHDSVYTLGLLVPSTGRDQLKSDLKLDPKSSLFLAFFLWILYKPIILGMLILSTINSIT